MIKLSDYVMNFLVELGTKHIFMLPGGGCMHLVDSLGKSNIEYTCCLHEQAVAIAAEAYAQYDNKLGVALVTTGPGGTNAVTGVAGGWIDSTPMLVISGQAKREDMLTGRGLRQMGIQELDIISVVSPITKYAVTVMEPEKIKYHLEKAVYEATRGRSGPVWLDIPLDVQGAMIDEEKLEGFTAPQNTCPSLDNNAVSRIMKIISASKRPVLLAGNGIRLANRMQEFKRLIEILNIPVLTTWKMTDAVAEDHPLFCGRPGIIASRGANFTQQNADCLIILGARLDLCQTGFNHPNFAKNARKIIIDIDQNEINKLDMDFEMALPADAGVVIDAMLAVAEDHEFNCASWLQKCKEWQKKYPVVLPEYRKNTGAVNTYYLIDVLSELLDSGDLLVPGSSGACAELTQQAFRAKEGQRVQNTPGLGAMGFGLPATIGGCIASGGKRTVGIVGDGGVQMNIQELQTLKRLDIPVKLFVLNNEGYGSIYAMQKNRFDGNFVACSKNSGLTLPDICKLADSYGLKSVRIIDQSNLKEDVRKVLSMDGPVICDVIVDPDVPTAPRLSSEVLPDGRIVSKPMEDLAPFLVREEFESNMDNQE